MARREIEDLFNWRGLTTEGQEHIGAVRARVIELADAIDRKVPNGKERDQAFAALREAMWWANSGIASQFRAADQATAPVEQPKA